MKHTKRFRLAALAATLVLAGAVTGGAPVGAQASGTSGGSAYGVQLQGPVPLAPTPAVDAAAQGAAEETAEDSLVHVPADPAAESFTALVQAGGSGTGTLGASLQAIIEGVTANLPSSWHGRGYAAVEDLAAIADTLRAQVVESESVAGCRGRRVVFGSGARVVGLSLAGTDVPIPNASPNQTLIDQGGVKIVLWETNWDPDTGGTTDGEDTVWTNALHVTAPGGIDLVVSHSEASADCAAATPPVIRDAPPDGTDIPEAPAAQPIAGQPTFTG